MFTQVCGLRTVMPSNPYDAKGLLIASIENDDPVIFLEPKRLYNGLRRPPRQTGRALVQAPHGRSARGLLHRAADKAAIFRPGSAVTVLAYGTMVYVVRSGRP